MDPSERRRHRRPGSIVSGSDTPFQLLVVGVDGSDGSRRALEWAAGLSKATGAHVLAVHVLTYSHEFRHDVMPETTRTWRRDLEHDLHTRWVEPLLAAGVEHRAVVVEGDSPAASLLDLADREHADLLIVGAKGRGGFADRVLGGVSYRVTHRAHQPVVVVPPDWRPAARDHR
jgi:nucleotide-binding universal stress UspA family protein